MDAGALGVEIVISGKLRTERSRREKFRDGYLPKSGEPSIKYVRKACVQTQLKPGILGVKVLIMPPEVDFPDKVTILEEAVSEDSSKEASVVKEEAVSEDSSKEASVVKEEAVSEDSSKEASVEKEEAVGEDSSKEASVVKEEAVGEDSSKEASVVKEEAVGEDSSKEASVVKEEASEK
jgi:ribosomal protein S3